MSRRPLVVDPNRLIVFDLETGGLIKEKHPIIQVCMMAVDSRSWLNEDLLEMKIKFRLENADPQALEANCWDPDVWEAEAIAPKQAAEAMNDFFKRHASVSRISKQGRPYGVARLCGWNSSHFDGPFLSHWYRNRLRTFMAAEFRTLDAMQLAMWLQVRSGFPSTAISFSLKETCERFGVEYVDEEAHDASYDVQKTVEILRAADWRTEGDGSLGPGNEPSLGTPVSDRPLETSVGERVL